MLNKSINATKMPKAILIEQSVGESISLATLKIFKQLKLNEQAAEGTAENTKSKHPGLF